MTPEEFRVAGHALIDWIADHRSRIPDLPVQSQVTPGQVAAALRPRRRSDPRAVRRRPGRPASGSSSPG